MPCPFGPKSQRQTSVSSGHPFILLLSRNTALNHIDGIKTNNTCGKRSEEARFWPFFAFYYLSDIVDFKYFDYNENNMKTKCTWRPQGKGRAYAWPKVLLAAERVQRTGAVWACGVWPTSVCGDEPASLGQHA